MTINRVRRLVGVTSVRMLPTRMQEIDSGPRCLLDEERVVAVRALQFRSVVSHVSIQLADGRGIPLGTNLKHSVSAHGTFRRWYKIFGQPKQQNSTKTKTNRDAREASDNRSSIGQPKLF